MRNKKLKEGRQDFSDLLDFTGTIKLIPMMNLFSAEAAKINADLKTKGITIGDNDCLIAGLMKTAGIKKIITKNVKHFSQIPGIEVVSY